LRRGERARRGGLSPAPVAAAIAGGLIGHFGLPVAVAARAEQRLFDACRGGVESCRQVLDRYPARRAEVDPLLFDHCRRRAYYCEAYLSEFPDGAHRDEADDLLFQGATTPPQLVRYERLLPAGRHVAEVRRAATESYDTILAAYRARAVPEADPSAPAGIDA